MGFRSFTICEIVSCPYNVQHIKYTILYTTKVIFFLKITFSSLKPRGQMQSLAPQENL